MPTSVARRAELPKPKRTGDEAETTALSLIRSFVRSFEAFRFVSFQLLNSKFKIKFESSSRLATAIEIQLIRQT